MIKVGTSDVQITIEKTQTEFLEKLDDFNSFVDKINFLIKISNLESNDALIDKIPLNISSLIHKLVYNFKKELKDKNNKYELDEKDIYSLTALELLVELLNHTANNKNDSDRVIDIIYFKINRNIIEYLSLILNDLKDGILDPISIIIILAIDKFLIYIENKYDVKYKRKESYVEYIKRNLEEE